MTTVGEILRNEILYKQRIRISRYDKESRSTWRIEDDMSHRIGVGKFSEQGFDLGGRKVAQNSGRSRLTHRTLPLSTR